MASTIAELRARTREGNFPAELHAQIEELKRKEGSNAKPFWELRLRDATDTLTLRVWSDSPNFRVCESLETGVCVEVSGEFLQNGTFGLDARRWEIRRLNPEECEILFAGAAGDREAVESDFLFIRDSVRKLGDPRLRAMGERFMDAFGARFARAAAARVNHHARRGGLVQHTAQMMRAALAMAAVYPRLNQDLLVTGVLLHDCGKLWETCPAENGFTIEPDMRGELMGHISIGVEVINALWRELPKDSWDELTPTSEDVRLHLIHLVLSHHGSLEFGSPVLPKTPEAITLHYLDNLDARLEMIFCAYETTPEIAPGFFDRVRPLNVSPVRQLEIFSGRSVEEY